MQPLSGTERETELTAITNETPVKKADDLQSAFNEDLRNLGVSNKSNTIKLPQPTTKPKL